MIDRHTAILSLVGGNLKTSGDNHEKVFYLDGQKPPSDEEIDAEYDDVVKDDLTGVDSFLKKNLID